MTVKSFITFCPDLLNNFIFTKKSSKILCAHFLVGVDVCINNNKNGSYNGHCNRNGASSNSD
jgi:hypothetical protein